jgi:hypothetical protein
MNATAQSVMIFANAKKGMDWAISSQATKKLAEGSTTRQSNLKSIQITVKCPRVQETRSPLLNIKGKVIVKDTNGNKFAVEQSDPRLISGKLVGVASGKRYKQNKKRMQVTCLHCSKLGDASNMKRWHFDRCKNRVKI